MSSQAWLPEVSPEFKQGCKKVKQGQVEFADINRLINSRLDANQYHRLAKSIKASPLIDQIREHFEPVKLGLVSNGTLDLMLPILFINGLRKGVWFDVILADFDQAVSESQSPHSTLCQAQPDLILVDLDHRAFPFAKSSVAYSEQTGMSAASMLKMIATGFEKNAGAPCILQNLAIPQANLLGSYDIQSDQSVYVEILDFNRWLVSFVAESNHYLLDVFSLSGDWGARVWFDQNQWLQSRIARSDIGQDLYTQRVASLVAAIKGKGKKCLVLDLDNTLWGGVIGDDGMAGIALQSGTAVGESHQNLQRYALELKQAGIILAVCSKNDHDNAIEPFQRHPDMILNETDIAVFVANWNDKASNIRAIAQRLNIGLDSLVFVDDNPAEREIVRANLPMVAVPEMGDDVREYVARLMDANYFETTSLTADDKKRAEQYRENAQRTQLQESVADYGEYLRSLDMQATAMSVDSNNITRVTQLINKTNQFNLTTQRYTQSEVESKAHSERWYTLAVKLRDKFGDNGLISVLLVEKHAEHWEIDTWLMSCRVIKRQLENWLCDYLVDAAKQQGVSKIIGRYIATEKNKLVADLLEEMGFEYQQTEDNWVLDTQSYQPHCPPIETVQT